MLRLLGRYIFREIFSSAVLGTLLATFILFLREVDPIFELLVKSTTANTRLVLQLFALAIPSVLPFTIPFGVLVGILIGLGRLAADGEITAMRAAGVSSRKVIAPVLLFAAPGHGRRRRWPRCASRRIRSTNTPTSRTSWRPRNSAPILRRACSWRIFPTRFSTWATSARGVAQHFRGRRGAAGEALQRDAR